MTWLADVVLIVHALFVVAVVGGLGLIWLGVACRWRWIRIVWLRGAHLAAVAFVALSSLVGWACPLTIFEDRLRGRTQVPDGFIQRWVGHLLYHDWPTWVFTSLYLVFAVLVALTWRQVPPRR
ncbi:membrane protein [Pandoraea terrae]|uniref:Membrane protein n=1 Tax=Pandoraea terrae TaxID=1537710 RepID=A0A5E4RIW4_9BURK|nr:DUF2784 domain-containing protein [Pandoraea terrae]VVD61858.1 membrane protein [Pandoraea terrae]